MKLLEMWALETGEGLRVLVPRDMTGRYGTGLTVSLERYLELVAAGNVSAFSQHALSRGCYGRVRVPVKWFNEEG